MSSEKRRGRLWGWGWDPKTGRPVPVLGKGLPARPGAPPGEPYFYRKLFDVSPTGGVRIIYENPSVPFSKLKPNDLLDTRDLQRRWGCSLITLYRYISRRGLKPSVRVGREMFFRKGDVVEWERRVGRPRPGRPRRGRDARKKGGE